MKFNWLVRARNPYFWVGLAGILFMAMGVEASMFTSWQAVLNNLLELIKNPFMIGSMIMAVWGYIQDFTTEGIGDTDMVMTYSYPRKDTETTRDEEKTNEEIDIPDSGSSIAGEEYAAESEVL